MLPSLHVISNFGVCDEWGEAKSRGNGGRPVELMIMNDTCATHRSRVPQRSCRRIKGGAKTREDQAWILFCVLCVTLLFVFIYFIKVFECSLVPASFFPYLRTVLQGCLRIKFIYKFW